MQPSAVFNLKASVDIEIDRLKERIKSLEIVREADPAIFEEVLTLSREIWEEREIWVWLCKPNMLLEQKTPLETILNGGNEKVKTILLRIIHGVYS